MPPSAGGVTGDVNADFHHQLGFHQRHARLPGGERPSRPRVPPSPGREKAGDLGTCLAGEGGGAVDVLQAAFVVVSAEQQGARGGQRAGDRADDRLGCLADLVLRQPLVDGR